MLRSAIPSRYRTLLRLRLHFRHLVGVQLSALLLLGRLLALPMRIISLLRVHLPLLTRLRLLLPGRIVLLPRAYLLLLT